MKIGLFAVVAGRVGGMAVMKAFAQNAERLGFSTLWAPEHVVLVEQYASRYPYASGTVPAPTDMPIADPFMALAYAAVTQKIRLATGICLVPEHNPLVLAKMWRRSTAWRAAASSSAPASAGWPRSFARWGFPWSSARAHARIYRGDAPAVDRRRAARMRRVRQFRQRPQLSQAGATAAEHAGVVRRRERAGAAPRRRVRRRLDRLQLDAGRGRRQDSRIEELLKSNGRKRSDVELAVSPYIDPITPDDLKRYRDAGVDEVVIVKMRAPRTPEEAEKGIEEEARKWIDAAAKL